MEVKCFWKFVSHLNSTFKTNTTYLLHFRPLLNHKWMPPCPFSPEMECSWNSGSSDVSFREYKRMSSSIFIPYLQYEWSPNSICIGLVDYMWMPLSAFTPSVEYEWMQESTQCPYWEAKWMHATISCPQKYTLWRRILDVGIAVSCNKNVYSTLVFCFKSFQNSSEAFIFLCPRDSLKLLLIQKRVLPGMLVLSETFWSTETQTENEKTFKERNTNVQCYRSYFHFMLFWSFPALLQLLRARTAWTRKSYHQILTMIRSTS